MRKVSFRLPLLWSIFSMATYSIPIFPSNKYKKKKKKIFTEKKTKTKKEKKHHHVNGNTKIIVN